MGIELSVIMQNTLDLAQIVNLPVSLNDYFRHHADKIKVRMHHGYSGKLVEGSSNDWIWLPNVDPYWLDLTGGFDDKALWAWGWKPDRDEPFEQWFQTQLDIGHLYLKGPYGFDLYVGTPTLSLATDINWHHFLFDEIVQSDVRRFCSILSDFFGGQTVIYISPDWPSSQDWFDTEHKCSYDQVLSWLRAQEPPKALICEMIKTEYWRNRKVWAGQGYYVDDFASIAREPQGNPDTMAHQGAV